jgi:glycosyltransferase involved in cell wall biosynthesis
LIRGILTVEPETRITAFISAVAPDDLFTAPWSDEVAWVRLPVDPRQGPPWNAALLMRAQWMTIPRLARRRQLDVVHGLANIVPLVSPGVATVVTLLDVTWIHYPRTMERRSTIAMKLVAPLCARMADRVVAISEAAKEDIVKTIRLDAAKVDVVPLGIRLEGTGPALPEAELRTKLGIRSGPIVLSVAQKREHKNLGNLIRAVARLPRDDVQVVLPGSPTPHERELRELAASLGIAERVRFPAWISQPQLEGLYAAASCFVLPSFMEGFGLPILEAMRRGLPVACSNASSLPEVAGDAALYFEPDRPDEIATAIERLLDGGPLVDTLIERGRARCREFTWDRTAAATLASYRRAIARS